VRFCSAARQPLAEQCEARPTAQSSATRQPLIYCECEHDSPREMSASGEPFAICLPCDPVPPLALSKKADRDT